jgi:two-component system, LuxR family, response regulator FixJ
MTAIVHVVDDDAAVRDSLNLLLHSAGYEALTYDGPMALLERARQLEPGCIVTDVQMPGMSGIQLLSELKRHNAPHPVVVFTGNAHMALAVQAMRAGAVEFIEKPFNDDTFLSAVKAALELGASDLAAEEAQRDFAHRLAHLTERERDVFHALVNGESNKLAAQRLGISPRTIEIYRANMMKKMGAENASQLIRLAVRSDIL